MMRATFFAVDLQQVERMGVTLINVGRTKTRMKKVLSFSLFLVLLVGTVFGMPRPQFAQAASLEFSSVSPVLAAVEGLKNEADAKMLEAAGKLDLNNVNVRAFLELPGMYPTVARKIIASAPYDSVDDVLDIPGLSERQISTIKKYMDQFTVTEQVYALTDGDDRINNGVYR